MPSNHREHIEQALTEVESETLFELMAVLEAQGWSYGANTLLRQGVFIGPNNEFDLWLSMRTGTHALQWTLQYPSTTCWEGGPSCVPVQGKHTLQWEYTAGSTYAETQANFLAAALDSIQMVSSLPRPQSRPNHIG